MEHIYYRHLRKYKYQLLEDYSVATDIIPPAEVEIPGYVVLKTTGELIIKAKYAWDGPSGPTIDTKDFMRGSLVHDAFYQLIREEKLGDEYRRPADDLLREHCRQDGMSAFRAWYVHKAVCWFGQPAVKEKEKFKKKIYAPKAPKLKK